MTAEGRARPTHAAQDRNNWGDQGPPSLDEVVKRLKEVLGRSQERRASGDKGTGSGMPTGGSRKFDNLVLIGVGVVMAILYSVMSLYTLTQQEQAVILRLGKFHTVNGPGLHFNPWLIDQRFKHNVTQVHDMHHTARMLTRDENLVVLDVSVQYRIGEISDYVLKIANPEESLHQALEAALRHVVGVTTMDDIVAGGGVADVAIETAQRMQSYLDDYHAGLTVTKVNVSSATAPREVQDAFDDVIKAREDKERFRNTAEAYANRMLPEARGRSKRITEEARAYAADLLGRARGDASRFIQLYEAYSRAPKVTWTRLHLEAVESVFRKLGKVVIDTEGTSLVYVPIDRLSQQSSGTSIPNELPRIAPTSSTSPPPGALGTVLDSVSDALNRRATVSETTVGRGR